MANVTESQNWEPGIYQIETTDAILGGAGGTANVQAKQLASRTKYLKVRADQIDAATAGSGSLAERLNAIDEQAQALGIDMQDMTGATLKFALDMAAQANLGVKSLRSYEQQEGSVTLTNRGIIKGCTISRNVSAARNLDLSAGKAFAKGQVYRIAQKEGAAAVPINDTDSAATVKAYLKESGDGYSMILGVTSTTGSIPDGGIHIYNVTIPAYHTQADISAVSLTSVRRVESEYPILFNNQPATYIPINRLRNSDYQITLEVTSATGGKIDNSSVQPHSRANNGFSVHLKSTADAVTVKWRVSRLNS